MQIIKKLIKAITPYGVLRIYQEYKNRSFIQDKFPAEMPALRATDALKSAHEDPSPVRIINFQVNNVCNSHCRICNIWQNTDDMHISLEKFSTLLRDDFFSNVVAVGITGGEPTLVDNLLEYYKVCIDYLPNLNSLFLITNCIDAKRSAYAALSLHSLCDKHNISCGIMLSVDGVGEVHDKCRRTKGNFKSFKEVCDILVQHNVKFSIGCTISKINIWHTEETLQYLIENRLDSNFRVAEFICRLNNNTCADYIRNFDIDESYQLQIFFYKLLITTKDKDKYHTYKNIFEMLQGNPRQISCWYQNSGINMDCNGSLTYCSVVMNSFDDGVGSLRDRFKNHLGRRSSTIENHCPHCIHDIHGTPHILATKVDQTESLWRECFSVHFFFENKSRWTVRQGGCSNNCIFIIGWYGTETVGDKAILAGIVADIKKDLPQCTLAVSSLYPFVTHRTLQELHIDAMIVPVYSESFFSVAATAHTVVIGGGPLMELEELSLLQWAFHLAKRAGHKTVIWGCGIGPLYTDEKKAAVRYLLEHADVISLRDSNSQKMATSLAGKPVGTVVDDPSIAYIRQFAVPTCQREAYVAFFLRELTQEYFRYDSNDKFLEFRDAFERNLAANIRELCKQLQLQPRFYAMHNFVVGGDDRDFNFRFAYRWLHDIDYYVEPGLSTIESITKCMQSSHLNVCMRFHSVIFAHTLNTNFVAIDYTSGEKVNSFLETQDLSSHMVTITSINQDIHALERCAAKITQYSL